MSSKLEDTIVTFATLAKHPRLWSAIRAGLKVQRIKDRLQAEREAERRERLKRPERFTPTA